MSREKFPAHGIWFNVVWFGLNLVPPAAALGLSALGAILFLRADKTQATPVLTNNAGPFNALLESAKQLIERFGILDLYPHA